MSADDDESAIWRAMREDSQRRRARNRENSAAVLRTKGIAFEERNAGAHLIVRHAGTVVDFWPGTGKWIMRGSGLSGRGMQNLINRLREVTR